MMVSARSSWRCRHPTLALRGGAGAVRASRDLASHLLPRAAELGVASADQRLERQRAHALGRGAAARRTTAACDGSATPRSSFVRGGGVPSRGWRGRAVGVHGRRGRQRHACARFHKRLAHL